MAMQSIVVGTDFSSYAALATERAALLASEQGATLYLLHVAEQRWMDQLSQWLGKQRDWHNPLLAHSRAQLTEVANGLGQRHPNLATDTVLVEGRVHQATITAVEQHKADLLVLGQHGEGHAQDMVMGTTTERLLNRSQAPVLVVKRAAQGAYQRVLVALDLSDRDLSAMALAQRVAPQAELVLMHSFSVPFENKLRFAGVDDDTVAHYREHTRREALRSMDALVQRLAPSPTRYTLDLREGDAARLISRSAREHGCDLVVMSRDARSAADELLLGSVARHTLAESPTDVLIATEP